MAELKDDLLTARELAEALKVTVDTVWRYTRNKSLPCLRLGVRKYRYRLDDVLAALSENGGSFDQGESSGNLRIADPRKLRAFGGMRAEDDRT